MAASKKQPAKGRKTTASTTKAKAAPKARRTSKSNPPAQPPKQRQPKAGPKTIRNLLSVTQHFRLQGSREKPYRIELKPRGTRGDTAGIPLDCQADTAFLIGLDRQFEIITEAEHRSLQNTYPSVGYQGQRPLMPMPDGSLAEQSVRIVRPSENTVNRVTDPYALKANAEASPAAMQQALAQKAAQEGRTGPVGPNVVNMPGGDYGMTAQHQMGQPQNNAQAVQQTVNKPVKVQRSR